MNSEIVKTLEMMCDKEDSQDKKLLLLAKLVETKCTALVRNQEGLKDSLDRTNEKLDKLTALLEKTERDTQECPVFKNKENFNEISFFLEHPKLSILIVLGLIALLGGFFGSSFSNFIKGIIGL